MNYELSLRASHLSHWFLGSLTDTITVTKRGDYDTRTILSGETNIPVLSVFIMGDTAAGGDTLEWITVANSTAISVNKITLKLFEDANADSLYQITDTLVTTFVWSTDRWIPTAALTYPLGINGNNFIFTVSIDSTYTSNTETLRLYIPVNGIKSTEENTAPAAIIMSSTIFPILPYFSIDTRPFGINFGIFNSSLRWGDIDKDGDLDIAVTGSNVTRFYRNDGANPNTAPNCPGNSF